jgi:hypothetical protein
MPNICCFCVFECAGMDIMKWTKDRAKMTNTSTGMEKGIKAEPGKSLDYIRA